jgi:hypothetical protein
MLSFSAPPARDREVWWLSVETEFGMDAALSCQGSDPAVTQTARHLLNLSSTTQRPRRDQDATVKSPKAQQAAHS